MEVEEKGGASLAERESKNGISPEELELEIVKIETSTAVSAEAMRRLGEAKPELKSAVEDAIEAFVTARKLIEQVQKEEGLRPGARLRVIEAIREEAERSASELLEGPKSE